MAKDDQNTDQQDQKSVNPTEQNINSHADEAHRSEDSHTLSHLHQGEHVNTPNQDLDRQSQASFASTDELSDEIESSNEDSKSELAKDNDDNQNNNRSNENTTNAATANDPSLIIPGTSGAQQNNAEGGDATGNNTTTASGNNADGVNSQFAPGATSQDSGSGTSSSSSESTTSTEEETSTTENTEELVELAEENLALEKSEELLAEIEEEAPEEVANTPEEVVVVEQVAETAPVFTEVAAAINEPDPVAQTPTLSITNVSGFEDGNIPLDINASLTNNDGGNESLSILISGVPDGASLSKGSALGDGVWSVLPQDLEGLQFIPAENISGEYDLTVTATASERGLQSSASTSQSFSIDVDAVADKAELRVKDASGTEDTAIGIDIDTRLTDADSETLSVTIDNVPEGASLSAGTENADGSWTLAPSDLENLFIKPPQNFSGDIDLNVTVISQEANGSTAEVNESITLRVNAEADAASLRTQNTSGTEDNAIAVNIDAALTDTDSETLSITIDNVPDGASLSAGTENADGSWTLAPSDLEGLTLTPETNFSGNINLNVTATTQEANGSTAEVSQTVGLTVNAEADQAQLNVQNSSGTEDNAIAVNIDAALTDTDSETLTITIDNVPDGASLSAGTENADGSWTLAPSDLEGLTLTPETNFSGNINLNVTATTQEANGSTAEVSQTVGLTVNAEADQAQLNVQNSSGTEDNAIAVNIDAALTDTDSETLSITIDNVPDGASLSAGTENTDGSWTLAPSDLEGLTLTPETNFSGNINLNVTATTQEANGSTAEVSQTVGIQVNAEADQAQLNVQNSNGTEDNAIAVNIDAALTDTDSETLSITIDNVPDGASLSAGTENADGSWTLAPSDLEGLTLTPETNFSGNINLNVTATTQEANGSTAEVSQTVGLTVNAEADQAQLNVQNSSGTEDNAIAVNIDAALTDTDSETLSITIDNVPDGASLSAGTENADGTWTLAPSDLEGLTLTPETNFSGNINLNVTATTQEANGSTAEVSQTVGIQVNAEADAASLRTQNTSGTEDNAIAVNIDAALTDTDSETLSITIDNVPDGASLSAGTENADGSWTLAPSDLEGLTLTPETNFSGNINLNVTATTQEANGSTAEVSQTVDLTVNAEADQAQLNVQNSSGTEDNAIAVNIDAALTDTDSETLSITIDNVPDGASLSAGTENADGSWTLAPSDLEGLTLTPETNFSGNINLNVTATTQEANGSTATVTESVNLHLAGVADDVNLSVRDANGKEDRAIKLKINTDFADSEGETHTITISNVPEGSTFNKGTENADGTWSFTESELNNLKITPPNNFGGEFDLTVTATAQDGTDINTVSSNLHVNVGYRADHATITAQRVRANEDTEIPLEITASLRDTDGSEQISHITIKNLPEGSTLSAGTQNEDGSWTLAPEDLEGLVLTPPTDYYGGSNAKVYATTVEPDGSSKTSVKNLRIDIRAVNDDPEAIDSMATTNEGDSISGQLSATDVDSNSLDFSLDEQPEHGTVTINEDGTFEYQPNENYSGTDSFTYEVTDNKGASTTAKVTINVADQSLAFSDPDVVMLSDPLSEGQQSYMYVYDTHATSEGYLTAWQEHSWDPAASQSNNSTKVQFTNNDGEPVGDVMVLGEDLPAGANLHTASFQDLPDGNVLLTYSASSYGNEPLQQNYAQVIDASGSMVGEPIPMGDAITTPSTYNSMLTVESFTDGSAAAVWSTQSYANGNNQTQVYMQKIAADGSTDGDAIALGDTSSGYMQGTPIITNLDNGNTLISWSVNEYDMQQGKSFGSQSGQLFDSNGNAISEIFTIYEDVEGYPNSAQVIANDDGSFSVVWNNSYWDNTGGHFTINEKSFDNQGNSTSDATEIVSNHGNGNLNLGQSIELDDGSHVVTWNNHTWDTSAIENPPEGVDYGKFAQIYDAQGNAVGNPIEINEASSYNLPKLFSHEGGFTVISYDSAWRDGKNQSTIKSQSFNNDGEATSDQITLFDADGPSLSEVSVTELSDGSNILTWTTSEWSGSTNVSEMHSVQFDAQGDVQTADTVIGQSNGYVYQNHTIELDDGSIVNTYSGNDYQDVSNTGIFSNHIDQDATENLETTGSAGDDILQGTTLDDIIGGGDGDDIFSGGLGNDNLSGGDGDDTFIFAKGHGHDTVDGGQGASWTDTIRLDTNEGPSESLADGGSWILNVDDAARDSATVTDNSIEFADSTKGSIVFEDGSQIDFENIDKLEWNILDNSNMYG